MTETTYDYMYEVTRDASGNLSVASGSPSDTMVGVNSNENVLNAGDEIYINGGAVSGLNGDYDYVGSIEHGSGFLVYNVANQNFYMLTNSEFSSGSLGSLTSSGNGSQDPQCFAAGTGILTSTGEVKVEDLKVGYPVLTADGRSAWIRWIGRQTVLRAFADETTLPVRIGAGALDENVPRNDLLVSERHALFVDGVLIQAGALVNGTTIVRERDVPSKFVFYHIELDDHSLVLAENTPAETFVDNVDRARFDNWHEYEALYPMGKSIEEMPYARAKSARQVPAVIRAKLAERAARMQVTDMVSAA